MENATECPICFKTYGDQPDGMFLCKDGKDNSEFADQCKHYFCVECCNHLANASSIVFCPLCREDWTEWAQQQYVNQDDEEEDDQTDETSL
jgi:hypothetical protein